MVLLNRWALPLAVVALALASWELHEQSLQLRALSERIDRLSEAVSTQRGLPADPRAICTNSSVGAEAIGAVVADVLARKLPTPPPSGTAIAADGGAADSPPPGPTDEQRQQLERAQGIVSAAVQSGVIRKDDVRELRRLRSVSGDPKAFEDLTGQIIRALNQGRLRPEDPHEVLP